jgi:uncharacterized protein YukE
MNFQVDPDLLSAYGTLLSRNGNSLSQASSHLSLQMRLTSADGVWIKTVVDAHEALMARMSESLGRGRDALETSAGEITRTADYYRSTDQTVAANLDATYPGSPRPYVGPPGETGTQAPGGNPHGANQDVEDPLQYLVCPATPAEFSEGPWKIVNTASDLISPTWWINQVINFLWGFNPLEYVGRYMIGDWEGFARCALVWEQLSKTIGATGRNIHNGLTWVSDGWHGHAADAAVAYFDYTDQALASHRDAFHEYHNVYYDVASDVWLCAKTLADSLKAIGDLLISIGLKFLSAKALSPTGVGAQALYALAAYDCWRAMQIWTKVLDVIGKTQLVINGFASFCLTPTPDTINAIKVMRMPANDYNHPGVE